MFNPSDPLFQANLPRIKEILKNDSVDIFVLATPRLRELISKNEHPIIQNLGQKTKAVFLDGNGLLIQKLLVWKWINGTLDAKHSFILSNCEIRVVDGGDKIIGGT